MTNVLIAVAAAVLAAVNLSAAELETMRSGAEGLRLLRAPSAVVMAGEGLPVPAAPEKAAPAAAGPEFFKVTQQAYQNGKPLPDVYVYENSVIFYPDAAAAAEAGARVAAELERNGRKVLKVSPRKLNEWYLLQVTFAGRPVHLFKASADGFASVQEARAKAELAASEAAAGGHALLETQVADAFGRSLYILLFAKF